MARDLKDLMDEVAEEALAEVTIPGRILSVLRGIVLLVVLIAIVFAAVVFWLVRE